MWTARWSGLSYIRFRFYSGAIKLEAADWQPPPPACVRLSFPQTYRFGGAHHRGRAPLVLGVAEGIAELLEVAV